MVTVIANLSMLENDTFWFVLDNRNLMHPFDDEGRRRDHKGIPKSIKDLVDDPFRSLAGELRRAGGYARYDALQRVSVGGFPPSSYQAQACRHRF
jgi:hypothetical protein